MEVAVKRSLSLSERHASACRYRAIHTMHTTCGPELFNGLNVRKMVFIVKSTYIVVQCVQYVRTPVAM